MHASGTSITDFIKGKTKEFFIPTYQRNYTWTKTEIKQLVDDLLDQKDPLFIGTIVVKNETKGNYIHKLIDGQQRVTSILLMAKAITTLTKDETIKLLSKEIYNSTDEKMKLRRINDVRIVNAILSDNEKFINEKELNESLYKKNIDFLIKYLSNKDVDLLWERMQNIQIAKIDLEPHEDENKIFESINSKGKSLTSIDLIKNYIDSKWEGEDLDDNSFSNLFDNKLTLLVNEKEMEDFFRQLIAYKTGKLETKKGKAIFYKFKELNKDFDSNGMDDLFKYASYWDYINKMRSNKFESYLSTTSKLNLCTIIFYYLDKYSSVDKYKVTIKDKDLWNKSLKFIVHYDILRMFAGFGIVEGNRSVPMFVRSAINDNKTLMEIMLNDKTNAMYPTPEHALKSIVNNDIYHGNAAKLKNTLLIMESELTKDRHFEYINNRDKFSIEHILPQSKITEVDDTPILINTLGNLTVVETKVNSKLSDLSLNEKRRILDERSYLKINREFYSIDKLTAEEIEKANIDKLNLIFKAYEIEMKK